MTTAESNRRTKTKHGESSSGGRGRKKPSRLYVTWYSMNNRCYCASASNYKYYGARGVTVCARWRGSFANFRSDMGEHPGAGWTLDRIDPTDGYKPENCRWATTAQQARNKTTTRLIDVDGRAMTSTDWANIYGVRRDTIDYRIKHGWSPREAVMTPPRGRRTS